PGRKRRISLQVPHARRRSRAVHRRDPRRGSLALRAALHRFRARLSAPAALRQERFRRFSRALSPEREVHLDHAVAKGRRRDRHRDQGAVAAHDPFRDSGARDRQRGVLPQHAAPAGLPRRARPAAREDQAARREARIRRLQDRRLRHAPPLLEGLARGGAAHAAGRARAAVRRHEQRLLRDDARDHAARHDGARISAGVPGARPAAARFADLRSRDVGEGISRRSRHRAVRRLRDGRVPARLRHVLLQALRRRAPRFGRSVRLGRAAHQALRGEPLRPAHEGARVLRRARYPEGHAAVRTLSRTLQARVRRRHEPHQRSRLSAVADRHQDGAMQRAAGREAVGFAGQEHVRRQGLPRVSAPGVRDHAAARRRRGQVTPPARVRTRRRERAWAVRQRVFRTGGGGRAPSRPV
ncbi:nicotinate phosphoribosyltransferase, partial [Burkholderia pseudomallei 406e]